MPSPIAIVAAVAAAGGIATLVGILVSGARAPRPAPDKVPGLPQPSPTMLGGLGALGAQKLRNVRDVAPKGYIGLLERQLVLAGRPPGWTVDKILVGKPLLGAVGAVLALWWVSGDPVPLRVILGLFLVVLCFFVPDLLIWGRAQERQEKIQRELPDTLDQMTISVEAGVGFESAMAQAGTNGTGPLAEELVRTLQDMSIGRSRKDAYQSLCERTSSEDLRRFTRSVIQADVYGIAIANVLKVQAGEMRIKRRQRAEEKAMKVPVKVIFPLVFCILPVLFIVLLTPAVLGMIEAFS